MTYIKLLTALAGLALLTACAGGVAINNTVNNNSGGTAVSCDTNPYGADCGTEFETQRLNIVSECTDDDTGDLCTDATTFACTDDFFHTLCNDIMEYEDKRTEFNNVCTNTKSKEVCDMEALVRTCTGNPFAMGCDATYNDDRETACESGVRTRTQCEPTITRICGTTGDIFDAFCTGLPNIDTMRITNCIMAGNAGESKCNNLFTESASNTCLTNPFTDACTSDTEFDDYADDARTNRVSFCASDSTNSSLCTALTTCQTNPFHASCGAYFESSKNPYCGNNPTATSCVNTTVWLASFTAGTAPPETPNTTTRENEFLQATTTGFASGATTGIMKTTAPPTAAEIVTIKFADADTATGGFVFFNGGVYNDSDERVGTGRFFYAGILDETNLGAPITETITSARWTGQVRAVSTSSNGTLTENPTAGFGLDITFDGTRETKGTMTAIVADAQFAYEIDGVFDENGIITGKVNYGAGDNADNFNPFAHRNFYTPGTLRGIIGQNGAVGVFHSDNGNPEAGTGAASFSGGFVVTPPDPCIALGNCPANTAAWLRSFTGGEALPTTPDATQAPVYKNQFLEITATTASSLTAVVPTTLFMTGSTTNGLAFFRENSRFYAGVLAGTNLGAPITETITNARWTGQIRINSFDSGGRIDENTNTNINFGLDITFDATRETKGTMKTLFDTAGFYYSIDGTFDDKGIIEGTVEYGATTGEGASKVIDTDSLFYSPATLSGIIGQEGAVGVFLSLESADTFFGGGFVVTPPS